MILLFSQEPSSCRFGDIPLHEGDKKEIVYPVPFTPPSRREVPPAGGGRRVPILPPIVLSFPVLATNTA